MSSAGRRTAWLFVFFLALYGLTSSGNVFRVPDEFEVYFQTEHLIDAGDISVPQTLAIRQGGQSIFFGEFGRDGRPYAPYGPLGALLAVPHHLAGRLVARLAGVRRAPLPNGVPWLVVVGGVTMLATATAAALAVAGFHRAVISLRTPSPHALVLALLLGGATVLWPYGTSFFSEAWQAAAFIWAAALLVEARNGSPFARARVIVACTLIAAAGLTKMTSLVFAPGFVIAVLCERSVDWRRRIETAVALGLGVALATAVHVAWNVHRFGQPFDFGYDWAETIPQLPARAFLASDIPRGLAVLLASPGKSVLLWAPSVVLAAARANRFARREPAVLIGVAVAAALGLVFFAAYLFPEGGYSHGPRNLVPIVPLLALPAAGPIGSGAGWSRPAITAGTVACAAVGLPIALLATSVSFLEDQGLGTDLARHARTTYYERIVPPPGRVWNRYRIDYIPFVSTLRSPGWRHESDLGLGPDYFPLHLLQARRQLPGGGQIPLWLVWSIPALWLAMLAGATAALARDRL